VADNEDAGPVEPAGPGPEALIAVLVRLADALDRQADPRPEALVFRKPDAARMCGMSVRLWERLLSAGKAPKPDAFCGKCPVWKKSTLQAWIDRGGARA
jgi:hypothetical protein